MKTVMVFGTFDLVHLGHIHLFRQAKRLGDELLVVVARDETVRRVKGRRPYHSERERVALLRHIDLIDQVVLGNRTDVYRVIRTHRPAVIALGYDQQAFVRELTRLLQSIRPDAKIVRLRPHRRANEKSGKMKDYLKRMV